MSAEAYFQQNPDVAAAYQQNNYGLTPEQFAQTHYELYGQQEQRAQPAIVEQITSGSLSGLPTYFAQNPDVAAAYVENTYGLTPEQFAAEHYARYGVNEQRVAPTGTGTTTTTTTRTGTTTLPRTTTTPGGTNTTLTTNPFANATQGFANNFNTYTSIPIGAQYNPNVVGGTGSPYSQIMRQMRPVGNPYMNVVSGLPMGGYDPNIYNPNLLQDFIEQRAADVVSERESAAAERAAAEYGAYKGGLITKVMGPKPNTPDDGTMFVQKGEYIIKKDAVNKYGKGLLDMVNEGKVPVAKMKSLLD